MQSLLEEYDR
jgi:hypothetical protein